MASVLAKKKLLDIAQGMGKKKTEEEQTLEKEKVLNSLKEKALAKQAGASIQAGVSAAKAPVKAYAENKYQVMNQQKAIEEAEKANAEYISQYNPSLPTDKATYENTAYSHDQELVDRRGGTLEKEHAEYGQRAAEMRRYEARYPQAKKTTDALYALLNRGKLEPVNPIQNAAPLKGESSILRSTAAAYEPGSWQEERQGKPALELADELDRRVGIIEDPEKALEEVNADIAELEGIKQKAGKGAYMGIEHEQFDNALNNAYKQRALLEAAVVDPYAAEKKKLLMIQNGEMPVEQTDEEVLAQLNEREMSALAMQGLSEGMSLKDYDVDELKSRPLNPEKIYALTADEKKAYDDLKTVDPEKADAYLQAMKSELDARTAQKSAEFAQGLTEEHPVLANALAVAGTLAAPIESAATVVKQLRGQDVDTNDPAFAASRFTGAVRGTTESMIDEKVENPIWNKVLKGGYNVATSAADNAARLLLYGGMGIQGKAATGLMAFGTYGNSVAQAIESGATQGEAALLGVIQAGVEYATEVLPDATYMRLLDSKDAKGMGQIMKDVAGAVLGDGLGETANSLISTIAEDWLIENGSSIDDAVNLYMFRGEAQSAEEATRMAWKDAMQAALYEGLIGAMSAGLLSGGIDLATNTSSSVQQWLKNRKESKAAPEATQQEAPKTTLNTLAQERMQQQQAAEDERMEEIAQAVTQIDKPQSTVTVKTPGEVQTRKAEAEITQRKTAKRGDEMLKVVAAEDGYAVEKNGERVNLEEMDAEDAEARMLETARDMTADAANDMLNRYTAQEDLSAAEYAKGYKQAYEAGRDGRTLEEAQGLYADDLSKDQVKSAWEYGVQAQSDAAEQVTRKTQLYAGKAGIRAHADAGAAGVSAESITRELSEKEGITMKLLDAFGKKYGLQFRIYDTLDKGAANASYIAGTNVVNVALDAQDGALTRAASHETYHYIEDFSQEDAKAIRAFVLDKLRGMEDYDLDARIAEKKAQYERDGVKDFDPESEIVADSLLDIIGTEENIMDLAKQSPTLLNRIREVVDRIRAFLQEQLDKLTLHNEEAAALYGDKEYMDRMAGMMSRALENAKENRAARKRVTQTAANDADVQAYLKDLGDAENAQQRANLLESLTTQVYLRTQMDMIQKTGDYEGGLQPFKDALKAFAEGKGNLNALLKEAGLDMGKSAQDNAVMAWLARELKMMDESGVRTADAVKYSLSEFGFVDFDKESKNNILQRGGIIVKTRNELVTNIIEALDDAKKKKYIYLGAIKESTKERIENDIGMKMFKDGQYSYAVSYDDIRHILPHYETVDELADAIEQVYGITNNYDAVKYEKEKTGQERLIFKKTKSNRETLAVEMVSKRNRSFDLVTVYDTKGNKKRDQAGVTDTSNGPGAPRYGSVSIDSVNDVIGIVKTEKFSLKDDDMTFFAEMSTDEEVREAGKLINRLHQMRKEEKVQPGAWSGKTTDVSKKILADTNSSMNQAVLTRKINTMYKAMDAGDVTPRQLMEYAYDVAQKVAEGASQVQELGEGEREARDYIRNTRIYLDADMQSEVRAQYGDLRRYYSKHYGTAKFTTNSNATSLEEMWGELHQMAPGYFKEDTKKSEMPMVLEGFLEATGKVARDYFGASEEQLKQDVAMRLFWEYYSMPGTYGNLKAQEKEMVERLADLQEGLRDTFEQRVQEKLEDYKAREERQRQRTMLERNVKAMTKRLIKPTKSQHIPEEMRGTVAKMLELVNTGGNKRSREKRTEAYNELLGMIAKLRETDTGLAYVDPDMEAYIEELRNGAAGKSVMSMNLEELKELNRVVTGIRHACTVSDQLLTAGHKGSVAVIADDARSMLDTMKDRKVRGDLASAAIKVGKYAMEDAPRFFQDLARYTGKAGKTLWDIVRHGGLDTQIRLLKEAENRMGEIHRKYKGYEKWMSRNSKNKTFQTESGEINLTTGQVMALYLLNKRPQARNHIYGTKGTDGGIAQGRVKTKDGMRESVRPSSVNEEQVNKIIDSLSKEQKAFADEMGKLLSGWCADLGNEVSMQMYGYKKFTEENYFPIKVWGGRTDATSGESRQNQLYLIMNKGFTKEVQDKAQAPLVIPDVFDAVTEHVNGMIVYNAWTAPVTDMIKFINYKFRDDSMTVDQNGNEVFAPGQNIIGTVKEDISRVMGEGAEKWYVQLIQDINGLAKNRVEKDVSGFASKLTRNFKATAVGYNIGTMLKQPTSVIRAFDVIPPMYFAGKPIVPNKQRQAIMEKYAPIVTWKGYGNFTMDTGKSIERILFPESSTGMERFNEWGMAGAGYMDTVTWHNIWAAAERMAAKKNKELQRGTDAFYKKTAEIFNQCIDQTQTVDSILHRSQMMRQDTAWIKSITTFMGEPMKSYNMLLDAVNAWKVSSTKERARKVSKAAGIFAANAVTAAFVNSLISALRNWDDEDPFWDQVWQKMFGEYEEDMTTGEKFMEAIFRSNLAGELNILNYLPLARDVVETFAGYDVERVDMSLFADVRDAVEALKSEKTATPEKIMDLVGALASFMGVPLNNVMMEGKRIWNWYNQQMEAFGLDTLESQYAYLKAQKNIGASGNLTDYANLLLKAEKEGRTDLVKRIRTDMLEAGAEEENIDSKIYKLQVEELTGIKNASYEKTYAALGEAMRARDKQLVDALNKELKRAGRTDEQIENGLIAWLKEDPRVISAAQKAVKGDTTEKVKMAKTLRDEGFSDAVGKKAINQLQNKMVSDSKKETAQEEESKEPEYEALYTYYDLQMAIEDGDDVSEIMEDLRMQGKEDNSIKSGLTSRIKPVYIELMNGTAADKAKAKKIKEMLLGLDLKNKYTGDAIDKWLKESTEEKKK